MGGIAALLLSKAATKYFVAAGLLALFVALKVGLDLLLVELNIGMPEALGAYRDMILPVGFAVWINVWASMIAIGISARITRALAAVTA